MITKLFIGMPVYNGERFISEAIDSLINQTYQDWSLLISDNASDDKTEDICKKYCEIDSRITYKRQSENIGVCNNYAYLLDQAKSEYFMWASSDDIWYQDFISCCIDLLETNKDAGMAFTNMVNIDSYNQIIREYPNFTRFSNTNDSKRIYNYIKNPEVLGKANLIYGIYRLAVCKKAWSISPLTRDWGIDMCFVLTSISIANIYIEDKILFKKRIANDNDCLGVISKIKVTHPNRYIFPMRESIEYCKNNIHAVRDTNYQLFVATVMISRIPRAVFNSIFFTASNIIKKVM